MAVFSSYKKVLWAIPVLLVAVLCYLIIMPYDFTIKITTKGSPGFVYQGVLDWNKNQVEQGMAKVSYLDKRPFESLEHQSIIADTPLRFKWKITSKNDSVSKIKVGINTMEHSIKTRILKLIGQSKTEKLVADKMASFYKGLLKYLSECKVQVHGIDSFPETHVAYVSLESYQNEKADQMIRNSSYINSFLIENGMKLIDHPFVHISKWNQESGKISYDFCFPITKNGNFPAHKEIKYKKMPLFKGVKASFYGNYSISDRAWFDLYEFSKRKEINTKNELIEVYYNNPHEGGKSIDWKTEIFLKIAN